MFPYQFLIFSIISLLCLPAKTQFYDILSNNLFPISYPTLRTINNDQYLMQDKLRLIQTLQQREKVKIQLYYECLCPDCRIFDGLKLAPTVKKLGEHLDVQLYPYGNAKTIVHDDGTLEFKCQHGPPECYGNMLHACAIDYIRNMTTSVFFNSCMMDFSQSNHGSDDAAADKCGKLMHIDSEPIKACAKSQRGQMLLKFYGDSSKKVGFRAVPHILINGVQNSGDNFFQDVCAAFVTPPPECMS